MHIVRYTAECVAAFPLVLGELGQYDCGSILVAALMDWMDARNGSYPARVRDICGIARRPHWELQ